MEDGEKRKWAGWDSVVVICIHFQLILLSKGIKKPWFYSIEIEEGNYCNRERGKGIIVWMRRKNWQACQINRLVPIKIWINHSCEL